MHGYRIFHWDDLSRNGNLKEWKLIIHGYTILNGGDLNEDETLKKGNYVFYLDRRINGSLKISQNVCNFLVKFVIEKLSGISRDT